MTFGFTKEKVLNRVLQVRCEDIIPNPHQPRRIFGDSDLDELALSIKQNGVLQPLTARRLPDNRFELISGERRLRAAKLAGLDFVPCIEIDTTERDSAVLALIENIQREDLSCFDEAYAIDRLIDFYGMTQEDAAIKLGKAQSTIANKLRLLRLSDEQRERIMEYGLTERHARALLKLSDEYRLDAIERIHKHNLNVSQTEQLIDQMIADMAPTPDKRRRIMLVGDVRIFLNTINRAIENMKAAGINANTQRVQNDDYIEYLVRIPIKK